MFWFCNISDRILWWIIFLNEDFTREKEDWRLHDSFAYGLMTGNASKCKIALLLTGQLTDCIIWMYAKRVRVTLLTHYGPKHCVIQTFAIMSKRPSLIISRHFLVHIINITQEGLFGVRELYLLNKNWNIINTRDTA